MTLVELGHLPIARSNVNLSINGLGGLVNEWSRAMKWLMLAVLVMGSQGVYAYADYTGTRLLEICNQTGTPPKSTVEVTVLFCTEK